MIVFGFQLTFSRGRDIITILGLGAGFYFGIDQGHKLTESIDATNNNTLMTTWNSISQEWLDFDKIFIDHPDYQKYIFDKIPVVENDCDKEKEDCEIKLK